MQTNSPSDIMSGIFNIQALKDALEIAVQNQTYCVLNYLQNCLGDLLLAAVKGQDLECAAKLLKAGANVNFENAHFKNKTDSTHYYAANFFFNHSCLPDENAVVSYLIENINCPSCDTYARNKYPRDREAQNQVILYRHLGRRAETPLSIAVENHDMAGVELLLQNGASMQVDCGNRHDLKSIYDIPHQTPFSMAIELNYPNILATFIQFGLNINKDVDKTVFESCSDQCLLVLLKAGLHHQKIQQNTSLAIAAGRHGDVVPDDDNEDCPKSLKFSCRKVIRCTLLKHNRENLIFTASHVKLPLPKALCRYIICNVIPM